MDEQNQNPNQDEGTTGPDPIKTEKSVPYERFQKVNEAKKQAEETLSAIAAELMEDIPEDMRDVVPDLPPADKIKWLRAASKKGLFTKHEASSGPDSKRPGGKAAPDLDTMTPGELISLGLKTR